MPPDIVSIKTRGNFPDLTHPSYGGDVEMVNTTKKRKKTKGFEAEASEMSYEASRAMTPMETIRSSYASFRGGHLN